MQGAGGASSEHRGLIPRSVEQIMESTRRLQKQGWSYKMSASVLELYNDAPKDLLLDTRSVSTRSEEWRKIRCRKRHAHREREREREGGNG